MQRLITLCTVLIVLLEHSTAHKIQPNDVHAQIQSYARQRSAGVRMPRASRDLMQCFDVYIPKISQLAESGKTESQVCITTATANKEERLQQVQEQRTALNESLIGVRETLRTCSEQQDTIEYLKCLIDSEEQYQLAIHAIADTAQNIFDQLDDAFSKIETQEDGCINTVFEQAKQNTDTVFETLQSCLINGFVEPLPDPEPQPNQEPEQQPEEDVAQQPDSEPSEIPEQQPDNTAGQEPEISEQLPGVDPGQPPEQVPDTEPGQLPEQEPNLEPGMEIEPGQELEPGSDQESAQQPETDGKPVQDYDEQPNADQQIGAQIPEEDLD